MSDFYAETRAIVESKASTLSKMFIRELLRRRKMRRDPMRDFPLKKVRNRRAGLHPDTRPGASPSRGHGRDGPARGGNGVPIEVISKVLGHANIQTTLIYANYSNKVIDREMEKFMLSFNV